MTEAQEAWDGKLEEMKSREKEMGRELRHNEMVELIGRPAPFSIRVIIGWNDGSSTERVYERQTSGPTKNLSKEDFTSFAVGDLINLVTEGNLGKVGIQSIQIQLIDPLIPAWRQ